MSVATPNARRLKRRRRVRAKVTGDAARPRISVFRSNRGIFAQLVDDDAGRTLELALGFSHPVRVDAPAGIDFEVPVPTQIVVRGIDKQAVGEVAARIRKFRPPEPYKGKGVRYAGEYVARKVGKRA